MNQFKKMALLALYPIYRAIRVLSLRSGLTVLTYHRVSERADLDDPLKVSAGAFDCQMRYLRDVYRLISPLELAEIIRTRARVPERSCLITFDDGWRDNFDIAYPILRKHEIPALIFLTTGFVGTNRSFWHEELRRILLGAECEIDRKWAGASTCNLPPGVGRGVKGILAAQPSARPELINDLVVEMKKFSGIENEKLVESLGVSLGARTSQERVMLSWDEICSMHANGITFGSHTVSHELLDRLAPQLVEAEVVESKRSIESIVGRAVDFISYPNGNFDEQTIDITRKAGYVGAFTCISGKNDSVDSPFAIRRAHIRESSCVGFDGNYSDRFFSIELSGLRGFVNSIRPHADY